MCFEWLLLWLESAMNLHAAIYIIYICLTQWPLNFSATFLSREIGQFIQMLPRKEGILQKIFSKTGPLLGGVSNCATSHRKNYSWDGQILSWDLIDKNSEFMNCIIREVTSLQEGHSLKLQNMILQLD